jgi:hypothetical protein
VKVKPPPTCRRCKQPIKVAFAVDFKTMAEWCSQDCYVKDQDDEEARREQEAREYRRKVHGH